MSEERGVAHVDPDTITEARLPRWTDALPLPSWLADRLSTFDGPSYDAERGLRRMQREAVSRIQEWGNRL